MIFAAAFKTVLRQLVAAGWGLVAARPVSVIALLLFANWAGPEPFAAFGVYLGLATVLWVIVSGRYEQAIVFARNEEEARSLGLISVVFAGTVVTLTMLCVLGILAFGLALPGDLQQSLALLVLPFSLAGRATLRLAYQFSVRVGNLGAQSYATWVQALVQSAILLGLLLAGVESLNCLAVADVAGYAAGTWVCCRRSALKPWRNFTWIRISDPKEYSAIVATVQFWRQMPIWNLPSSLISVMAVTMPVLAISAGYPAAVAGQIILAIRLLEMPLTLLTGSATPVLQNTMRLAQRPGPALELGMLWLFFASVSCFGTLAAFSALVGPWFLATRWNAVLEVIPMLAPYYIGLTISGTLIDLVAGFRAERSAFLPHLLFFLAMSGGSLLFFSGQNLNWALTTIAIASLVRAALFANLLKKEAYAKT